MKFGLSVIGGMNTYLFVVFDNISKYSSIGGIIANILDKKDGKRDGRIKFYVEDSPRGYYFK